MSQVLIIAATKVIDEQGSLDSCLDLESRINQLGYTVRRLTIDPLSSDWHGPLAEDHFRCGCAPIEALARAKNLIEKKAAVAVVISGEDALKSGYQAAERRHLMAVYGEDLSVLEAYSQLATVFSAKQGCSEERFRQLAEALFSNYLSTYQHLAEQGSTIHALPSEKWYQPITSLFRGVDCANPLIDFRGRLLICSRQLLDELEIPLASCVSVDGVGLDFLPEDGPAVIDEIVTYKHLAAAYRQANEDAGVDFAARYLAGEALLEVYTCYPVVPMAFLLASKLVPSLEAIPAFLQKHEITVTGGMNLARAPWNNPALNGLISMVDRLRQTDVQLGVVHGNGGLGYHQGVAILSRAGD